MDDRVRAHAETLVDWSARIDRDDQVVVTVGEGTHDLAVAVADALGERRATPVFTYASDEVERAYLLAAGEDVADPDHTLALYEKADAVLALRGGRNTAEGSDVPGPTRAAHARANQAVREARMATAWVSTAHPTHALAQQAGMSYEAYRDFAYGAILRDWEALAEEMGRLKALLDEADSVRIVSGETDLRMSITNRTAVNSAASVAYGSHNLPSGEVFTAPVTDSVEGQVRFDLPIVHDGQEIREAFLRFEDGEVVDHDADIGASVLADLLETDPGARRLGELGIGMNRGIDRVTGNLLFDEKMAGTVHLALGRAYDDCLPPGEPGNESAVHVDLLVDMRGGSRLGIDGEVVQRNGIFRWDAGLNG
mgnify:CR=1 FL=1